MTGQEAKTLIREVGGLKVARDYRGEDVNGISAKEIRKIAAEETEKQKEANKKYKGDNARNGNRQSDLLWDVMYNPMDYVKKLRKVGLSEVAEELKGCKKAAKELTEYVAQKNDLLEQLRGVNESLQIRVEEIRPVADRVVEELGDVLEAEKRAEKLAEDEEAKEKAEEKAIKALMELGKTREQALAALGG